ncbi:MAG: DUF4443 domain-containing protein [Nitrosopumilus sp.]|nr:DUF4443 domain-containing protein [Nitrosopumilus sp.]
MHQQIKTLQNIVTRKGSSKVLTFSAPHVLKSIFYLSSQKYVSRASFCREIHLGEGAVKTLISHLKEYEIVDSIKSGTFLTKKGIKLAAQFQKATPSQCFIKKCQITNGIYNYAILLKKKYVSNLGNGMKQRDYAILYGASDSLTLIFKEKEFVFSGDDITCFTDEPETRDALIEALKPAEGDIIIITSSNDKFVAEISAINTILWTLRNEKN